MTSQTNLDITKFIAEQKKRGQRSRICATSHVPIEIILIAAVAGPKLKSVSGIRFAKAVLRVRYRAALSALA